MSGGVHRRGGEGGVPEARRKLRVAAEGARHRHHHRRHVPDVVVRALRPVLASAASSGQHGAVLACCVLLPREYPERRDSPYDARSRGGRAEREDRQSQALADGRDGQHHDHDAHQQQVLRKHRRGRSTEEKELMRRTFAALGAFIISDFVPYTSFIPKLQGWASEFQAVRAAGVALISKIIQVESHREQAKERDMKDADYVPDFVDVLLKAPLEGDLLSDTDIVTLIVCLMNAGTDTSALTVEWAMGQWRSSWQTLTLENKRKRRLAPSWDKTAWCRNPTSLTFRFCEPSSRRRSGCTPLSPRHAPRIARAVRGLGMQTSGAHRTHRQHLRYPPRSRSAFES